MTLPASGQPISFSQLRDEFGANNGTAVSLGAYRVSQSVGTLTNLPLDTGIPQSGTIKSSDFFSKKLNVVIDETPSSGTATRVNAKNDYDANNSKVKVIGNFRTRPSSPAGIKVWIHTNGPIGSNQKSNTTTYCSFLTGSWDSTTDLYIDIGTSGAVYGAGGDGGIGGSLGGAAGNGGNGTSAIGISKTNNVILSNRGSIVAGGAGGGGGAHGLYTKSGRQSNGNGGGGGGGNGYPAGSGGSQGSGSASPGVDGTLTTGGNGGNGSVDGQTSSGAMGGGGGGGGSLSGQGGSGAGTPYGNGSAGNPATTTNGGNGGNAGGNGSADSPGSGGINGYAIVVSDNNTGITINNTGTIIGNTVYNTAPT